MSKALAFIGCGFSNLNAFITFVEKVNTFEKSFKGSLPKHTIYLIDYEENHGFGKAWGRHAYPSMLYSDNPSNGIDGFKEWIDERQDFWLNIVKKYKNSALKTWFEYNKQSLEKNDYSKIFMPRFIRGIYQRQKLFNVLRNSPKSLQIIILNGKVVNNTRNGKKYFIEFQKPAIEIDFSKGTQGLIKVNESSKSYANIKVDYAVVGIGPSEPKVFEKVKNNPCYFANTNELHPNLEGENFIDQFKKLVEKIHRKKQQKVNVGVLGSGLSFLDIVNTVHNDAMLSDVVSLTSISNSGFARTESEGQDGKQKDMAFESQIALGKLLPKFISAHILDLDINKHGAIIVKTSNKHLNEENYKYKKGTKLENNEHVFDVVIQSLGFGKWQDSDVFKNLFQSGIIKIDNNYPGPALDKNMKMADKLYMNGQIITRKIVDELKIRGQEDSGFLNNIYRSCSIISESLFLELYSDLL